LSLRDKGLSHLVIGSLNHCSRLSPLPRSVIQFPMIQWVNSWMVPKHKGKFVAKLKADR